MAKSGFVPAWMKISSSDKTNGNQKLNIDASKNTVRPLQTELNSRIITGRQRHHSSEIDNHTTTRHTLFYHSKTSGRCRNKSNDQQLSDDSSLSRRSYSRERLPNTFGKDTELNSYGYTSVSNTRPSNPIHQRRLHFFSSSPHYISRNNRNSLQRLSNNDLSDISIKGKKDVSDPLEKDFPSLNNTEKSPIWTNAASKFRLSNNEISSCKYFDRSLSTNNGNLSHTFGSNRSIPRTDRLLSTPNNFHITTRPLVHDLQTYCITQTKNLDQRSSFSSERSQPSKGTLFLLSVPETSEEKEFLVRLGWNDEMNYEITDQDREEYEKRIQLLPKIDNRTTALMSALNRRALPCINIRDILQLEMITSPSDDESSDD